MLALLDARRQTPGARRPSRQIGGPSLIFWPFSFACSSLILSRVMGARPDEMRLSRQTSLQGALTSKRWCVAVWGFRLVGWPARERREQPR